MTKDLEMRKLLIMIGLLHGASSADAGEPQKWCSPEGAVIIQSEGAYLLDGKPVEVERERVDYRVLGRHRRASDPGDASE